MLLSPSRVLPETNFTTSVFQRTERLPRAAACLASSKDRRKSFWDVSDPGTPQFLSAADPPLSAITDEFHALPEGGFLVTMMGGAMGHAPGRVAEFDRQLKLIHEHPDNPPDDSFNPHGIA